jgi:hypothetical protein
LGLDSNSIPIEEDKVEFLLLGPTGIDTDPGEDEKLGD